MSAAVWAIPLLTAGILLAGLLKGTDLLSAFAKGAARGLESARSLLPSLILFMTAIGMFRASGALEVLSYALRPLAKAVGLPEEVVPLALLRPVSASASLSGFRRILEISGPDSFPGQVASVIQSASETTFYTIALYTSAAKLKKSRHALLCSLIGDLTVILTAGVFLRLFL